jgi:hypothetical protein
VCLLTPARTHHDRAPTRAQLWFSRVLRDAFAAQAAGLFWPLKDIGAYHLDVLLRTAGSDARCVRPGAAACVCALSTRLLLACVCGSGGDVCASCSSACVYVCAGNSQVASTHNLQVCVCVHTCMQADGGGGHGQGHGSSGAGAAVPRHTAGAQQDAQRRHQGVHVCGQMHWVWAPSCRSLHAGEQ